MFKTLHIFTQNRFLQCKVPQVKALLVFYIVNILTAVNSYFQTWLVVTQCANLQCFIKLDLKLIEI